MKIVALIILIVSLLQPLACFAHPCDSCLGNVDTANTSGTSGSHSHNHDADDCDSSVCCAEYVTMDSEITVKFAPLVSALVTTERYQKLPTVVMPIFIPPQNLT
jgi:hypothetical protein